MKEKLLAAAAVRRDKVILEGEAYIIREVGALEFGEYGELLKKDKEKAMAKLIAACIIDEDGAPLLNAEEALQVARTARLSTPVISKIMELSGFGGDDTEDAEKHSDAS